ncbi:MAG: tRNA pseudouridine(38-40) synthase TruA [Candidatus Omnitrophica bacterium]|nr:tRNA pseudouridine(38-40) synthase TruA [Candidatus Omnitrophota bacterium]
MRNIKLTIEYDGTLYSGWQTQNHLRLKGRSKSRKTIQSTIENVLNLILQEHVNLTASGRTDAGVHARAQTAHFKTRTKFSCSRIQFSLNSLLPRDIIISSVKDVSPDFHARFSAVSKWYRYTILTRTYSSAFFGNFVWRYPYPVDINKIKKEARFLVGTHDFKSFQTSGAHDGNTVRTVYKVEIIRDKDLIYIDIRANGFLYNMVRSIVGTLMDINRGKLKDMKSIVRAKDRKKAGITAPPQGLCLMKVYY